MRDDRLLEGVGDVEAGKPLPAGAASTIGAEGVVGEAVAVEVDEDVSVAEAEALAFALVHAGRARAADAAADETDEHGAVGPVRRH